MSQNPSGFLDGVKTNNNNSVKFYNSTSPPVAAWNPNPTWKMFIYHNFITTANKTEPQLNLEHPILPSINNNNNLVVTPQELLETSYTSMSLTLKEFLGTIYLPRQVTRKTDVRGPPPHQSLPLFDWRRLGVVKATTGTAAMDLIKCEKDQLCNELSDRDYRGRY